MKIAIISPGPFSVPPVIGTSVEHDIQMVAEQLKEQHEVTVYTRKCPEYRRSSSEGNLRYKRYTYSHPARYLRKVIRHIKKQKPDIIMVENRPSYVLRIKANIKHIPVALNMHSMLFASPPQINREKMNQVAEKVDGLITNSRYLLSEYESRFPAFKGKGVAVHLGIHPDPFELAQQRAEKIEGLRKKLSIQEGDQTILFVGRLMKEKGIHMILDVMPKLIKKYPKLKLIITGSARYGRNASTPYVRKLNRQAAKLRKHVVFTQFVRPNEIPYVYQLADIVVIPSFWQEPFGRVNLEAMASSKAIVASDRGGIPEVVKHEENGFVFPLKNYKEDLYESISQLLEDEDLRAEFGQKGLERVKQFTWARTAEQYLQLFQTLAPNEQLDSGKESCSQ
ncbi:hypothetical protein BEP19_09410 [Ammoniphilus oxalaticus]|uniref:Glycosyl transferase family 1 n=1 Tax=Ammoniphilus oxalaticus TaxID=66863 RepID=A0A419SKP9_9BACL|nr:glycosyltransferase family 4 protein [Ammoniphilus oxalaticus]RKD24584.1 hypothetical protein BEP19_09410 [Ammoniphilus oxalaticus]